MGVYFGLKNNGTTNGHIKYLVEVFNRETKGDIVGGFVFFSSELRRILLEERVENISEIMTNIDDLCSQMHGNFAKNSGDLLDEKIPKYLEEIFSKP